MTRLKTFKWCAFRKNNYEKIEELYIRNHEVHTKSKHKPKF